MSRRDHRTGDDDAPYARLAANLFQRHSQDVGAPIRGLSKREETIDAVTQALWKRLRRHILAKVGGSLAALIVAALVAARLFAR